MVSWSVVYKLFCSKYLMAYLRTENKASRGSVHSYIHIALNSASGNISHNWCYTRNHCKIVHFQSFNCLILELKTLVQWNLIITVTYGPKVCVCNKEVAALQRCKFIQSYYLELEVGGCNNEVAALQSDHYTEVPLYTYTVDAVAS